MYLLTLHNSVFESCSEKDDVLKYEEMDLPKHLQMDVPKHQQMDVPKHHQEMDRISAVKWF